MTGAVSLTDPPARPSNDPTRHPGGVVDVDELHARVSARQIRQSVHTGSFMLLGVGLLMAVAVAAMLVVAW
jgi:hypothetical protein